MSTTPRPAISRRRFLAATPAAAGALWLSGPLIATPASATAAASPVPAGAPPEGMPARATVDRPYGPFYRENAPHRAKVSPPLAAGTTLVQSGRIWGLDTRRPLAGARMEIWQVDVQGRYSDGVKDRSYRASLIASGEGGYEFETIHPVGYKPSPGFLRSPHIHYQVVHPGYRTLVSEFFFAGDSQHDEDTLFHPDLVVALTREETEGRAWEAGRFDIVLEPA